MKNFVPALLVPFLSLGAIAQNAFQAKAILSTKDGDSSLAWILAATDKRIRYKTTAASTDSVDAKIKDFSLIYLMEPAEYSTAMDLFEAGKFKQAQEEFAKYKKLSTPTAPLGLQECRIRG